MPSVKNNITGKSYWRSLDELADTEEFRTFLAEEFPGYSSLDMLLGSASRRRFLKIMGASLAFGGLTGCRRWIKREIAPYASRPEGHMPGVTEQYATVMEVAGTAWPLLVTSFDGRPIKVEGNPEHPASRGAANVYAQAGILEMYDPQRSRSVMKSTGESRQAETWDNFDSFAQKHFAGLKNSRGKGLAVLSESSISPSYIRLKAKFINSFPEATWTEYEPLGFYNQVLGARKAYGQPLRTHLKLDKADIIVSLDADLLGTHPDSLRLARDWAVGRNRADKGTMSRMYMAEGAFTLTGSNADNRLALAPSKIAPLALAILRKVTGGEVKAPAGTGAFVNAVAADLKNNAGRSVIVAGPGQSPQVHAICCVLNDVLGNVGRTVEYTLELAAPNNAEMLTKLAKSLDAGSVDTLLILGGNPAYDAPADLDFASALGKATTIHLSHYDNETSRLCDWHLPRAHYLEAWGDGRSWDGTISTVQPLIEPLYKGRSVIEMLSFFTDGKMARGYDIVRETFREFLPALSFEKAWRKTVHDGFVPGSQLKPTRVQLGITPADIQLPENTGGGMDVAFVPDTSLLDGRFANNGWLQELPDPLTMLTWDNAALVGPATAEKLNLTTGDMLNISVNGRSLDIAVFIMPGVAADTVALALGYGRTAAGHVGDNVGFNTYALRTTGTAGFAAGAQVKKISGRYKLVTTQNHHTISNHVLREKYEERLGEIVREADLQTYRRDPHFANEGEHADLSLQMFEDPLKYDEGHRWGMAIDMNSCIGCSACIVACQSENNIPIVGKEEVSRGREMHWIRVDRYFLGDENDPQIAHQPMTCHHCETAPCEQVCPAAATMHDSEGLNVMVYNRCIGTRYCANNCPYKVRRFNYYDWHARDPRKPGNDTMPNFNMPDTRTAREVDPIVRLGMNPDVSVRMRGVMEKCTFCTQRIQSAKIAAKNAYSRGDSDTIRVQDGAVTPACAQTCPTQAIVFGDLNDPHSRIHKLHRHNRAYALLEELNVRPRLKFLAKVRNGAPLAGASSSETHSATEA